MHFTIQFCFTDKGLSPQKCQEMGQAKNGHQMFTHHRRDNVLIFLAQNAGDPGQGPLNTSFKFIL